MDYHKMLKVRPGATREEIRKAYRKFAFHFHPDRSNYNEELFLIVQEALMKMRDEEDTPPPPPPPAKEPQAPKKDAVHNMAFVKQRLKKTEIWAPDFHVLRRPKIEVESSPCPSCAGKGVLPNKFNIRISCPQCKGSRLVTKIHI